MDSFLPTLNSEEPEKVYPDDVANFMLWLASDDSRMCTSQLWVKHMWMIVRRLLHRRAQIRPRDRFAPTYSNGGQCRAVLARSAELIAHTYHDGFMGRLAEVPITRAGERKRATACRAGT